MSSQVTVPLPVWLTEKAFDSSEKVTETELASVIVNSQTPVPRVQWPRAEPVPERALRVEPVPALASTLIVWP